MSGFFGIGHATATAGRGRVSTDHIKGDARRVPDRTYVRLRRCDRLGWELIEAVLRPGRLLRVPNDPVGKAQELGSRLGERAST